MTYIRDPGPPTWQEAIAGHSRDLAIAERAVERALLYLLQASPDDRRAREALSQARGERDQRKRALERANAFLEVHPMMLHTRITTPCGHDGGPFYLTCWVGDDAGYYRAPAGAVLSVVREPGEEV